MGYKRAVSFYLAFKFFWSIETIVHARGLRCGNPGNIKVSPTEPKS